MISPIKQFIYTKLYNDCAYLTTVQTKMYLYILINVYFTCTNQNVNSHKFYTLDYCLHCSGSKLYLMLSFWKRILFYLGYCNKSRGNERILQPKKIDGEYEGKVFCCFNSFSEGFDKLLMAFCIKSR